jgi:hypothetical protein
MQEQEHCSLAGSKNIHWIIKKRPMPANEFEKQVQHIMEGLKLPPSPPVWENIEEQIRKKKDRRKIIFWFFFFFLILSGGLWLAIGIKNKGSINQKARSEQNRSDNHNSTALSKKNKNAILDKQNKNTLPNVNSRNNKKTTTAKKLIEKQQPKNELAAKRIKKEEPNVSVVRKQNETFEINQQKEKEISSIVSTAKDDKQTEVLNEKPIKTETQIIDETKQTTGIKQNIDSSDETKQLLSQTNPAEQKNKKSKNNKWRKQVTAEIGWSDYGYGFFGIGEKSYDATTSVSSAPPFSNPVYSPQQITKGLSAAFGFEWARSVSKRFEISFGLQYHYFSTHTKTGAVVEKDTTINYQADVIPISRYYKNGNQSNYTNRFHVIEIPLSVQYRLFKNFPLYLGMGASYGHLLKTNALSFNSQSNIYYRNKKDYVSNYINIFSSLQYEWLHKAKFSIRSGPIFYYSASQLQRSNSYGSPHLFSAGIKTSIKF